MIVPSLNRGDLVIYKTFIMRTQHTISRFGIVLGPPDDELDIVAILSTSGKTVSIFFSNIKKIS